MMRTRFSDSILSARLRRLARLLPLCGGLCAFLLAPTPAHPGEVLDLRDGVRTNFYGARYTGSPPVGDFYGWAMTFGDFDGDGLLDFFSSSANAEGPNDEHDDSHEQDVYLFFGRPRAEFDSVYAVDEPDVADIVFYKGGFEMACADVDNDGFDDAILAEVPSSTDPAQGGIYIIFGRPREQLRRVYDFKPDHHDYTPPDVHIMGATRLGGAIINVQNAGYDLASRSLVAGDLNGDGYADVAFGYHLARGPFGGRVSGGAAYIVFGRRRDQFPPVIDIDYTSTLPHPDVVIWGESGERYPFTLAIGDIDGDGISDLIARSGGRGEENIDWGEIHGFLGKRTWKPAYDTQIEEFDFALDGGAGYRMVTGDLDGDGRDDLIVGSPLGDWLDLPDGRRNMGGYRIYFGRPRSQWPKWSDAIAMTDVFIVGADLGEAFTSAFLQEWGIHFSIATGNRDADGYDDLLIGAGQGYRPSPVPFQAPPRSGRAYLLRGRPPGAWQPFIDLRDGYDLLIYGVDGCNGDGFCTGTGAWGFDLFGYTTAMGDLDGNGLDELFISAQFADGPDNTCSECGEVYVIFDTGDSATPAPMTPPLARAALLPNYPNPFHASTTLAFRAPPGSLVSLTVYDALGREVARPLFRQSMTGDERTVRWDARDLRNQPLPSGIYFVKLKAGEEAHSRKVLFVR